MRALRNVAKTPVIALAGGYSDPIKRVALLEAGADDALDKPFHRDELIARLRAIVRRSRGHALAKIVVGDLTLDLDQMNVTINKTAVHLTGAEWRMLQLLALRVNTVVTKQAILDHLYGGRDEPELKTIDVFICKLRRKLFEASGGRDYIETIWGRGYALRKPDVCPTPNPRYNKTEASYRQAAL